MNEKLTNRLFHEFPNLYRDKNENMQNTVLCWGIGTSDGWFQIIYDLSKKLEEMILELPESKREHIRASQVKEKYGTLRFYMTASSDRMNEAIGQAEELCIKTCEYCGQSGELRCLIGWFSTECDSCFNEKKKRLKKLTND